ncbi:MAG: hypothetical protein O3B37_04610 [Proteobacteria bacterium]|nr:hypothetical protein [Pseudomonadota bacterium]
MDINMKRICNPIVHVENTTNQRQFENLRLAKERLKLLEHILAILRRIPRHMFGPQNGGPLPGRQARSRHVVVRLDCLKLFFRNSRPLTKRRVVLNSMLAPVDETGLDDHHLLDPGRKDATGTLSLDNHRIEHQEFAHLGQVGKYSDECIHAPDRPFDVLVALGQWARKTVYIDKT